MAAVEIAGEETRNTAGESFPQWSVLIMFFHFLLFNPPERFHIVLVLLGFTTYVVTSE